MFKIKEIIVLSISSLKYGIVLYNNEELNNKKLIVRLAISSVIQLILINTFLTPL